MRNSRRQTLHRILRGGEPHDYDQDELARVAAGLRRARPVVPTELCDQVHSLRPAASPKSQPSTRRWMPAIVVIAAVVVVPVAPMLVPDGVPQPSKAPRILVALDASSNTVAGPDWARAIRTTLVDELPDPRSSAGVAELVVIGSAGRVLLRTTSRKGDRALSRKDAARLMTRYADTVRVRPTSQSDFASALNVAGRELRAGTQRSPRYLVILTDGLSTDRRRSQADRRRLPDVVSKLHDADGSVSDFHDRRDTATDPDLRAFTRLTAAMDLPDLRGVRVWPVQIGATGAPKSSRQAAARARLWLTWAQAAGARVAPRSS
jgi:hypothetical protein